MSFAISAGIVGTGLAAGASLSAAEDQEDAAHAAGELTNAQYKQSRQDLMPWQITGKNANKRLATLLGIASETPNGPDWDAYLKANPDVAASATYANNPAQHYEDYGRYEGRKLKYFAPSTNTGDTDFGSLLKTFTPKDLESEPGYQFGLTEGEKAIDRLASSRGGYFGGANAKNLIRFNQDYGGTKYGEAFNRDQINKNTTYNMLSGVSGTGANTAGRMAGLGENNATRLSDLITGGANAGAAGTVGAANAINNGISTGINWQQQSRLMDLIRQPTEQARWNTSGRAGATPAEPGPGF